MAYDTAIGKIVLFGGLDANSNTLGDTWAYDGTTWAPQAPLTSPHARSDASMVYVPIKSGGGELALFGGLDATSTTLADTWIYNGTTWAPRHPTTSPPARSDAAMATDASTGQAILFGGLDQANTTLGDTWIYSSGIGAWTPGPASGPPARSFAAMTYVGTTGTIVMAGGLDSTNKQLGDTWAFNGTAWAPLTPATSPPARSDAAMTYDAAKGRAVLFGGLDAGSNTLGDTWTYDGSTWHGTGPSARGDDAMAYDPALGRSLLFGGLDNSNTTLGDTWTYDGSTWVQQSPTTSPPARAYASMAFDAATNQMVLFGGLDASGKVFLDDTWTYDGTTWKQQSPAGSPPARIAASMAYDATIGKVVLVGGQDAASHALGDTWTYDGTNWTQQSPAVSPPSRSDASMAYDFGRGQLVLFGGLGAGGTVPLGDTWTYDGTTWTQQSPATSPTARAYASSTYDASSGQIVLFGGIDAANTVVGDTWTYDGTTWTQQSPTSNPSGRSDASMTFDPSGKVLLFGGLDHTLTDLGDIWSYLTGVLAQTITFTSPAPTGAVVGGAGYTPTATASSGLAVTVSLDSTSHGCSLSGGVVQFTAAGICVIDANQAGSAGYSKAPQVQQSISVTSAGQAIAFTSSPPTAVVGGPTYQVTATGGASGNPVTFSVDASSTSGCTISGSTVSFAPPGGICVVDANQAGNATYGPAPQVQQSITVTSAAQVIAFTSSPPTAVVGGPTYQVTATGGASGNPVTFSVDPSSTSGCTISGSTVSFAAPAGTCVIDANQAAGAGYSRAVQVQQTFAVQILAIITTAVPKGKVAGSYLASLTAIGGHPPYAWKVVAGSLPKGLKLNKANGTISGTTKTAGTSWFTVEVLDTKKKSKNAPATRNSATASLSITVASGP